MANGDELPFQIEHQMEELRMTLVAYTLIDVIDHLRAGETHRVTTQTNRAHRLMRFVTAQLDVLEMMSPREYQKVRRRLGDGSGDRSRRLARSPQLFHDPPAIPVRRQSARDFISPLRFERQAA